MKLIKSFCILMAGVSFHVKSTGYFIGSICGFILMLEIMFKGITELAIYLFYISIILAVVAVFFPPEKTWRELAKLAEE